MGLYLTEWLNGPEAFLEFAEIAWDPIIFCEVDDKDPTHLMCSIATFNVDDVNTLVDHLGHGTGKEFIQRLNAANDHIFKKIKVKKFIDLYINEIYKETGFDIVETSKEITELFNMYVLDIEFWGKLDIVELYKNLIFYGVEEDLKPLKFFIPPRRFWESDFPDGWAGYFPYNF